MQPRQDSTVTMIKSFIRCPLATGAPTHRREERAQGLGGEAPQSSLHTWKDLRQQHKVAQPCPAHVSGFLSRSWLGRGTSCGFDLVGSVLLAAPSSAFRQGDLNWRQVLEPALLLPGATCPPADPVLSCKGAEGVSFPNKSGNSFPKAPPTRGKALPQAATLEAF